MKVCDLAVFQRQQEGARTSMIAKHHKPSSDTVHPLQVWRTQPYCQGTTKKMGYLYTWFLTDKPLRSATFWQLTGIVVAAWACMYIRHSIASSALPNLPVAVSLRCLSFWAASEAS